MAVVLRFAPKGLTTAKYDEIVKRLEEKGAGSPPGRLYHFFFGDPDNLLVSEIWDSVEASEEFGKTLKPILEEAGVEPGDPTILKVHNIVVGAKTATANP